MFTFHRRCLTLVSGVLLAALLSGCAWGAQALRPDDKAADSGTEVLDGRETREVAVGDEFELRLDANASTGCSWVVTGLEESVLELVSNEYVEGGNAEGRLGAGGQAVLRFRAVAPGRTVIELAYGHAWEIDEAAYARYEVEVSAR